MMLAHANATFTRGNNANLELINRGATGVDINGNVVDLALQNTKLLQETPAKFHSQFVKQVKTILTNRKGRGITTSEIAEELKLDEKTKKKLSTILKKSDEFVRVKKGNKNLYYLKSNITTTGSLF